MQMYKLPYLFEDTRVLFGKELLQGTNLLWGGGGGGEERNKGHFTAIKSVLL